MSHLVPSSPAAGGVPVDGHAHWYPLFGKRPFLDAALANFRAAGSTAGVAGILLFADPEGFDTIEAWRSAVTTPGWTVHDTSERESLLLASETGPSLIFISGRQVVSAERLEVLALATAEWFPPKLPVRELLRRISDAGAVPILPWGFGKWWGRRGRLLRQLMENSGDTPFHLGDSGGRPQGSRQSSLFALAQRRGIAVLPGTDPLPVPNQARRIGAYGFYLPQQVSSEAPAVQLRQFLAGLPRQPATYGRRDSALEFMSAQLMLRRSRRPAMLAVD